MGNWGNYLDTILVPLSLFVTVGYHAYLWHSVKYKPYITTFGINTLKRRDWLLIGIKEGNDKKEMLAVQSLRNTLMESILTATITGLIQVGLAALASLSYTPNNSHAGGAHFFTASSYGLPSDKIILVKFGVASIFLLTSFLFSTIAVSMLIESNFLINSGGEIITPSYKKMSFERGFMMSVIGNRVLCVALPMVAWLLGPIPVALSAMAMVWVLYGLDFPVQVAGKHS